jgi:hypothetical protein
MSTLSRPWSWLPALALAAALCGVARGDDPPPPGMDETPPPADEPESPAAALDGKIKLAIDRGVEFLKSRQMQGGTWGDIGTHVKTYAGGNNAYQHPLGPTAMALYAMLKCEVPEKDPVIRSGLAWLQKAGVQPNTSSYELSAVILAVTATADPFKKSKDSRAAGDRVRLAPAYKKWVMDLTAALLDRRGPAGWRYRKNATDPGGTQDVSGTQFALLALTAADRCGLPVDRAVWADAAAYVLTLQEADGPETERAVRPRRSKKAPPPKPDPDKDPYAPPKPDKPPMDRARGFHYSIHPTTPEHDKNITAARTACGIGSLALARSGLDPDGRRASSKGAPDPKKVEQGIYDGLAWLTTHWDPWSNPGAGHKNIFYLYSVERAMDMVGAARLGDHIWYLEMVEQLLPKQDSAKGFWDTHDAQVGDRNPVVDTAFALLFLRRASDNVVPVPVLTGGDDAPVDGR